MNKPINLKELPFDCVLELSERQHDVFVAIGEGMSSAEIGQIPLKYCSVKTIEAHIAHIKDKLGLTLSQLRAFAAYYVYYCTQHNVTRAPIEEKFAKYRWVNKAPQDLQETARP